MESPSEFESLRIELADKEAMLRDTEAGNIQLGNPWEGRADDLRRRLANLKLMIEKKHATRTKR